MADDGKKIKLPEFEDIAQALSSLSLTQHASEIHGTLCGFIGVGVVNLAETYIQELIEEIDVQKHEQEIRKLAALLQTVYQQMSTQTFDFHLLMPDDEASLADRAKAMSMWCHGYSDGFLQSGIDITELKTEEARDALYHITEVSQLDYQALNISEDDEKSFMELYEYIRMAVLMIYTEITQSTTPPKEENDKTIH